MFDELHSLLDKVCGAEADTYADGDSIVELHRCLARLEAATTRCTATFEAGGEWEADGARSVPAWLARRCRVPKAAAARRVQLGRDLRHLAVAEEAGPAPLRPTAAGPSRCSPCSSATRPSPGASASWQAPPW